MYVLVTGLPASGKSTLAGALAAELRLPLYGKDPIKEALADVLGAGRPDDVEWSGRLGGAAAEVLWRLLADSPAAVVDLWVRPEDRDRVAARLARLRPLVEVWCACPAEEVLRRYAARAGRHPVHKDAHRLDALRAYTATAGPLRLGPVLRADTSIPVDATALAAEIRAAAR
ncbi:MAG: AAA family ATPase [Mycobacteriales bacterium]